MDWARLRGGLEGQRKAFEDLVCQLAELEMERRANSFRRKGPGADAGVECAWLDAGGGRHAWQAKFFTRASEIDWNQVEGSVHAALKHHDDLVSYTICFAVDLSDGPSGHTQQNEWDTRTAKWRAAAEAAGLSVDFRFWGTHQIDQRLTRPGREGLIAYWFNQALLSAEWFDTIVRAGIADADTRYSPRVNVSVETSDRLDEFVLADAALGRLRDATRYVESDVPSNDQQEADDELRRLREETAETYRFVQQVLLNRFDRGALVAAQEAARRAFDHCWELETTRGADGTRLYPRQLDNVRFRLSGAQAALPSTMAAQTVLLTGEAGTGKSHLLCDFAVRKLAEGHPVILLLGTSLFPGPLWDQFRGALGLSTMGEQEFLGALQSAATSAGKPAIVIVDGINEGGGRDLWHPQLAGLIERGTMWANIKFIFSIRDEFVDHVVPSSVNSAVHRIIHEGLGLSGPEAVRTYFAHYQLDMPSSPLVGPEYSNPLFLRLLCEGLVGAGLKRLPVGWTGLRQAHDLYVQSLDRRLLELHGFTYDPALKVAERAAKAVAALPDRIPLVTEALEALGEAASDSGKSRSDLLRALEREGLFSRLPASDPGKQRIRFAFELVDELLTAEHLVDGLPPGDHDALVARLQPIIPDEPSLHAKAGLVAQLAVVLPELLGIEVFEILNGKNEAVAAAALRSMVWRTADSFDERFTDYLNGQLMVSDSSATLSNLVQLSVRLDHPFNAERLHQWLSAMDMPDRDEMWSTWTHFAWRYEQGLSHFVSWFRTPPRIAGEEALLAMTTLAWLCTSSDRVVRDRSTKAIATLMRQHPQPAVRLLARFKFVNDTYVLERLLAAAYAAVLFIQEPDDAERLGREIVEVGLVAPPNALIRDSVAGTARRLHRMGRLKDAELALASPVRRTQWPQIRVRERSDLKRRFGYGRPGWEGYSSIWSSVVSDMGDFHRYTLHADSPSSVPYSSVRRQGASHDGARDRFLFWSRLTGVQARTARRLIAAKRRVSRAELWSMRRTGDGHPVERAMLKLRRQLPAPQARRWDDLWRDISDRERDFDVDFIARWVFERTLAYGWTPRFGGFEQAVGRRDPGRAAGKPERIGKKYQWLAFHELGARLTDNFALRQRYRDDPADFRGIWETDYPSRDIDPTFLAFPPIVARQNAKNAWWHSVPFDQWGNGLGDDEWQERHAEIPDLEALLQPVAPDGQRQLVLDGHFEWRRPEPPASDTWSAPARYMWVTVRAFTFEAAERDALVEWASDRHFAGTPSSSHWGSAPDELFRTHGHLPHDTYFLEHPEDLPAQRRVDGAHPFDPIGTNEGTELPHALQPVAADYYWETGLDTSIEDHVNSPVPSPELFRLLRLSHGTYTGEYIGGNGRVILQDPSLREPGPSALVADRGALVAPLAAIGRDLVWFVNGERLATDGMRYSSGRAYLSGFFWLDDDGQLKSDIKTLYE